MQDTDMSFFLVTGLGDGVGVAAGHFTWFAAKKAVTGTDRINLGTEGVIAAWLGTAAVFSGTAWQPIVNVAHTLDLGFTGTAALTWGVCASAFYAGLRVGRGIWSNLAPTHMPALAYDNLKTDAQLA